MTLTKSTFKAACVITIIGLFLLTGCGNKNEELATAIKNKNLSQISELTKAGIDSTYKDSAGKTFLDLATETSNPHIIKLVNTGLQKNIMNSFKGTWAMPADSSYAGVNVIIDGDNNKSVYSEHWVFTDKYKGGTCKPSDDWCKLKQSFIGKLLTPQQKKEKTLHFKNNTASSYYSVFLIGDHKFIHKYTMENNTLTLTCFHCKPDRERYRRKGTYVLKRV